METIHETRLTREQARDLGRIVGILHACGPEIPAQTNRLTENYEFPFCTVLRACLADEGALSGFVAPHAALIDEKIDGLLMRAARLRRENPPKVICHTDIHGWNLMQDKRLILVDWEGITLASPEADLFAFTVSFFFGYAWDDIMSGYRTVRPGFVLDEEAAQDVSAPPQAGGHCGVLRGYSEGRSLARRP